MISVLTESAVVSMSQVTVRKVETTAMFTVNKAIFGPRTKFGCSAVSWHSLALLGDSSTTIGDWRRLVASTPWTLRETTPSSLFPRVDSLELVVKRTWRLSELLIWLWARESGESGKSMGKRNRDWMSGRWASRNTGCSGAGDYVNTLLRQSARIAFFGRLVGTVINLTFLKIAPELCLRRIATNYESARDFVLLPLIVIRASARTWTSLCTSLSVCRTAALCTMQQKVNIICCQEKLWCT